MIHLLVNNSAKSGREAGPEKPVTDLLTKKSIPFTLHRMNKTGDTTETVRALCQSGEEADIWVLGGDGTINEAVNGLTGTDRITMAFLPGGSGNDYVRGIGFPLKAEECARKLIAEKKKKRYDVGEVMVYGTPGTVRFAGSCGIGYDAKVCNEVEASKLKKVLNKLHLGKLTYLLIAFRQVFVNPRFRATVIVNGVSRTYSDVIFMCFMNNCYEGGGLKMAPKANPCDGELSCVMAYGIRPLRVLWMLPKLLRGTHVKNSHVQEWNCREIEVITDRKQYLHTDGDVKACNNHFMITRKEWQMTMPACGTDFEGRAQEKETVAETATE